MIMFTEDGEFKQVVKLTVKFIMTKKKIAIATILIACILTLLFLFLNTAKEKSKSLDNTSMSNSSANVTKLIPSIVQKKKTVIAPAIESKFSKRISSCLNVSFNEQLTIPNLTKVLFPSGETQKVFHWKNWHYKTDEGRIQILKLVTEENENRVEIQRLKRFEEDEDGLPFLKDIPAVDQINPTNQTIMKYLPKELIYNDHVYGIHSKDLKLTINESSLGINEIKITGRDKYLECEFYDSKLQCKCLN
jgi:hypothetical protein